MTQDDDTNALFQRVLEALTRAGGNETKLLALLTELPEGTRATALIRALLIADASLRATFAASAIAQRDRRRHRARRAGSGGMRRPDRSRDARPPPACAFG